MISCERLKVPVPPVISTGYTDDLATATISKHHTDMVNCIVHEYGKKWRFRFNAAKSAVMVFVEGRKVNTVDKKDRMFRLGPEGIKEKGN